MVFVWSGNGHQIGIYTDPAFHERKKKRGIAFFETHQFFILSSIVNITLSIVITILFRMQVIPSVALTYLHQFALSHVLKKPSNPVLSQQPPGCIPPLEHSVKLEFPSPTSNCACRAFASPFQRLSICRVRRGGWVSERERMKEEASIGGPANKNETDWMYKRRTLHCTQKNGQVHINW